MNNWENVFNNNLKVYIKIIINHLVENEGWETKPFAQCVSPLDFKIPYQVQKKDYLEKGSYPIVAQGKNFIDGYSNNKEYLIYPKEGIICFGDHTRMIKFIDFPFIVGADGVKLIKASPEYIPKMFYYLLNGLDIESRGYGRHYKLLRSSLLPFKRNQTELQQNIINFLDDFKVNNIKQDEYFSKDCENKIIKIHDACINQSLLREEIVTQETLLTKLRQSILQEAVQGKLVPQDPNDEPWQEKSLEEVIQERPKNGYSPKSVSYPTEVKNLTLTATTSGRFNCDYFKYLAENIPENSHLWLKNGDILIQRGNSLDYVGIAAIYTGQDNEYIYPDLMMKIRAKEEVVIKEFLHLVLISDRTRSYFKNNASGTSGSMPKINQKILLETQIPLPPLAEQKRIVEKVDKLMQYCDELEEQIKQTKTHSEQLMQAVLQGAFNPEQEMVEV